MRKPEAELVSAPDRLVAAGLPLVVGALSIVGSLGLLALLSDVTPVSNYALNVTTILGLALAAGVPAAWWIQSQATPRVSVFGPVRPLTTYIGIESEPALSPDGNQIAFAWNGPAPEIAYARRTPSGARRSPGDRLFEAPLLNVPQ